MIGFGIDVSKGYCNIAILDSNKSLMKEVFQVNDTITGYETLEENLIWASNQKNGSVIRVGLESTGGYETNFLTFLLKVKEKYNLEVYRLNPLSIKKYSDIDLHKSKTDDISSLDIASYIIDMSDKQIKKNELCILSPEIQGLRRLIKLYESATKRETGLRNELQIIIQQTFPELIKYMHNGIPEWILKLLFKYQDKNEMLAANISELSQIPYLSEAKAKEILELCNSSVETNVDSLTKLTIKQCCKKILNIIEDNKEILKEIEKAHESISDDKLETIHGISSYTAAVILAFTVNINRFNNVKEFIAFFGLDPRISDSGDKSKKRKISKKGNSIIRKCLYMSVLSCLNKPNHPIYAQYNRLRARGVVHFSAMTACMRKFLCIIFGILKSNKVFDINYENKEKTVEQSEKSLKIKKLNIKKSDSLEINAPISNKERKRRKAVESYNSSKELVAGSSTAYK